MTLLQVCEWLETTGIAILVRESLYGFPIVVGLHLFGLACSVGLVIWFDLRLLGIALRGVPVSVVYRRLMPWTFAGFALMFLTGGILFAGFAVSAYGNLYFRLKLAAMVLAGLNAAVYHIWTDRRFAHADTAEGQPLPARMAGLISIAAWAVVVLAGRLMSYTMF